MVWSIFVWSVSSKIHIHKWKLWIGCVLLFSWHGWNLWYRELWYPMTANTMSTYHYVSIFYFHAFPLWKVFSYTSKLWRTEENIIKRVSREIEYTLHTKLKHALNSQCLRYLRTFKKLSNWHHHSIKLLHYHIHYLCIRAVIWSATILANPPPANGAGFCVFSCCCQTLPTHFALGQVEAAEISASRLGHHRYSAKYVTTGVIGSYL